MWPLMFEFYRRSHCHCSLIYKRIEKKDISPNLRWALEQGFQAYLVLSCCRKMHRRVREWSFLGVVCLLYGISDEKVVQAYKQHWSICNEGEANTTDRALVNHLGASFSAMTGIHETILQNYLGQLANVHSLQLKIWLANTTERKKPKFTIYDETSCADFHKFLIAILISYAKALHIFYDLAKTTKTHNPLLAGALGSLYSHVTLLSSVDDNRISGILASYQDLSLFRRPLAAQIP